MTYRPRWQGKQPRYTPGRMNGTESAYAEKLRLLQSSGAIEAYVFESVKLRLADNTYYTPDFFVIYEDHFEIHEVKGFWREDARVKWKVAAEQFPWFRFVAAQMLPKKQGGGWKIEVYGEKEKQNE